MKPNYNEDILISMNFQILSERKLKLVCASHRRQVRSSLTTPPSLDKNAESVNFFMNYFKSINLDYKIQARNWERTTG